MPACGAGRAGVVAAGADLADRKRSARAAPNDADVSQTIIGLRRLRSDLTGYQASETNRRHAGLQRERRSGDPGAGARYIDTRLSSSITARLTARARSSRPSIRPCARSCRTGTAVKATCRTALPRREATNDHPGCRLEYDPQDYPTLLAEAERPEVLAVLGCARWGGAADDAVVVTFSIGRDLLTATNLLLTPLPTSPPATSSRPRPFCRACHW